MESTKVASLVWRDNEINFELSHHLFISHYSDTHELLNRMLYVLDKKLISMVIKLI